MSISPESQHGSNSLSEDLEKLLSVLPPRICEPLRSQDDAAELLEVVLDLGRVPTARFLNREMEIGQQDISTEDLNLIARRIGDFGQDNRAGLARTRRTSKLPPWPRRSMMLQT